MRASLTPAPRLLVLQETAQRLQDSVKTIRRWIERGELRCHKLGRQFRIPEEDLAALVNRTRT